MANSSQTKVTCRTEKPNEGEMPRRQYYKTNILKEAAPVYELQYTLDEHVTLFQSLLDIRERGAANGCT